MDKQGAKMKKYFRVVLFTFIFAILANGYQCYLYSCLIFKVARGNQVFVGNNEDFSDPVTLVWFLPPEKGKYGRVYFGHSNHHPQGGVNDQGLFFDWVAGYKTDWRPSPDRLDYEGNLNEKVLEECATVEEAVKIYQKYDRISFRYARILLADRTGASVIIGWAKGELKFYHSKGTYQVLGYRDHIAELMLKKIQTREKELSIDYLKSILDACHQEGRNPTKYSNIHDLKNNIIYVYQFHNYDEVITIDLDNELKKGKHQYIFDKNNKNQHK